jgi:hypothetical protein
MKNWKLALATLTAVAATACTTPASTSPDAAVASVDPTGNWSVTYSFAPSCGNPASTTTGTFAVTFTGSGYSIEVAGVSSVGVLACDATECRLSGTWAWQTTDTAYQQSMNLTLGSADTVSGDGTEAVITTDSNCTYPFTVTGTRM